MSQEPVERLDVVLAEAKPAIDILLVDDLHPPIAAVGEALCQLCAAVGENQIRSVAVNRADLPPPRQEAQLRQLQHPLRGVGHRAEAVAQLLPEIVELLQITDARQSPVNLDPQL